MTATFHLLIDPVDDHHRVAGLHEAGALRPVGAHRHVTAGEGDVAGAADDDAIDLDLRAACDQLREYARDVVAAVDRGAVGGDQAAFAGEAGGRGLEVSPAERCGEGVEGVLGLDRLGGRLSWVANAAGLLIGAPGKAGGTSRPDRSRP